MPRTSCPHHRCFEADIVYNPRASMDHYEFEYQVGQRPLASVVMIRLLGASTVRPIPVFNDVDATISYIRNGSLKGCPCWFVGMGRIVDHKVDSVGKFSLQNVVNRRSI